MLHPEISHGFPSNIPGIDYFDVGAHLIQHLQDSGARGVQPHVLDGEIRSGHQGSSHEPERC